MSFGSEVPQTRLWQQRQQAVKWEDDIFLLGVVLDVSRSPERPAGLPLPWYLTQEGSEFTNQLLFRGSNCTVSKKKVMWGIKPTLSSILLANVHIGIHGRGQQMDDVITEQAEGSQVHGSRSRSPLESLELEAGCVQRLIFPHRGHCPEWRRGR